MTHVLTLLPILASLVCIDNQMNLPNEQWVPKNEEQIIFANACWLMRDSLLSENNFNKTMEPIDMELDNAIEGLHIYSQMELEPKWQIPGEKIKFSYDNYQYAGVLLEKQKVDNHNNFEVYKLENYPPIIAIRAEKNDIVYLTVAHQPLQDFALFEYINELRDALKQPKTTKEKSYHRIRFPMITIDVQPDISWMYGMNKNGWVITQATQEVYFALNEQGIDVQYAPLELTSTYLPKVQKTGRSYNIQEPCYVWVKRPGVKIPLFMAYVGTNSWQRVEYFAQ